MLDMPESFQLTRFASETEWREYAAAYIEMLVNQVNTGSVSMALAGGATPYPVYRELAQTTHLPWDQITLYQTDERYVQSQSEASNQRELRDTLGEEVVNRLRGFEMFDTSLDWEESADEYAARLEHAEPGLDIVVLGIGSDGHFASLFPEGPYWEHEVGSRAIISNAPAHMEVSERLSLAPRLILESSHVVILIRGERKQDVVQELACGNKSVSEFPARALTGHPRVSVWWSKE